MRYTGVRNSWIYYFFIAAGVAVLLLSSCRRPDSFKPSGSLAFSSDTVKFDTIFTTMRSPTERLYVNNNAGHALLIEKIELEQGDASEFEMTFDGVQGNVHTNYEMLKGDSLIVLLKLKNEKRFTQDTDIYDKLIFTIGGQKQTVTVFARVLDAYIYRNEVMPCNFTLPTDKPIVVDGVMFVDTFCTLTIPAGAKLYFTSRQESRYYDFTSMIAVAGSLVVEGTDANPVLFTNFRINKTWQERAGQWQGIRFLRTSEGSFIRFAKIQNGSIGIQVDSITTTFQPKVQIENTEIRNMSNFCVLGLGFSNTATATPTISAVNVLAYNAGQNVVGLFGGGTYEFTNCTMVNFGQIGVRQSQPTIGITNFLRYEDGGKEIINVYPADFRFYNSVVWGSKEEEFGMRFGSGASLNLALVNSLLRTKQETILNAQNQTNLLNINPQFTAPEKFDFTPKIGSPLIDAGDSRFAPTDDATGKGRIGLPDIGAFEYRPN